MASGTMDDFLRGQGLASLHPGGGGSGPVYEEVQVAQPVPWLPIGRDIAWGMNDRTVSFLNATVNVETSDRIGFDTPAVAYAITAAVQNTAGAANPATGFAHANDQFRIQFVISGVNRTFQSSSVLGSTVCGTAERPRMIGRAAWRFGSGSTLLVRIVPLVANIRVDINVWVLETTAGSNVTKVG